MNQDTNVSLKANVVQRLCEVVSALGTTTLRAEGYTLVVNPSDFAFIDATQPVLVTLSITQVQVAPVVPEIAPSIIRPGVN